MKTIIITIIITIFTVVYVMQMCFLLATIMTDSWTNKEKRDIKSKKDLNAYLIPFGFLIYICHWYKKLD